MNWPTFANVIEPGSPEERLLDQIDPGRLPVHAAIIMDGNGRWARQRGLTRIEGHYAGLESVREVIETAARLHLAHLTLYAFSVENWKRPKTEVNALMRLLRKYIRSDLADMKRNNIRLRTLGRIDEMDGKSQELIRQAEAETAGNTGLVLSIALNYGGQSEITDACRRIALEIAAGTLAPEQIDPACVADHLYTAGLPEPDLLIRTSGEFRISNFLLWQLAYTEFHFTDVLWPDFRKLHLFKAIIDFQSRRRRFGGL